MVNQPSERVHCFKFLGMIISSGLEWGIFLTQMQSLEGLYFLRQLKKL